MKQSLGLYIHIPFCASKCHYCDFLSYTATGDLIARYIDTLCREICSKKDIQNQYLVDTIFIGGGTPSILEAQYIVQIMDSIHHTFQVASDAEVTIEVNPGTVSKEKLSIYKQVGMNRLSIGLQTTDRQLLKKLGRIHNYEEYLNAYHDGKLAGFENISTDIIFSIPNQTIEILGETIHKLLELDLKHISAYSLMIEEGTKFYNMMEEGSIQEVDEQLDREMYYYIEKCLKQHGFHQYEISNFAKMGYESKHNIRYWELKEYIGFGLGAASQINETRYYNIKDLCRYINQDKFFCEDIVYLDNKMKIEEYIFLGLRMNKGIDIFKFQKRFEQDLYHLFGDEIVQLKEEGLLKDNQKNISLTAKGRDISNYVMAKFIL